jgi:hypothetical protein
MRTAQPSPRLTAGLEERRGRFRRDDPAKWPVAAAEIKCRNRNHLQGLIATTTDPNPGIKRRNQAEIKDRPAGR